MKLNSLEKPYSIKIYHFAPNLPSSAQNVDVEVRFKDGKRYAATFFTLDNIQYLMKKNEETGECLSGLYFWASNPVIVSEISEDIISETISSLLANGELDVALERLPD